MNTGSDSIRDVVAKLELEAIAPTLRAALEQGEDPQQLLQAMTAGMIHVGELFEQGEYYLADLVLAGELMKEGLAVIQPLLGERRAEGRGTVVLCTVKGDIHDIGKNLVAQMLESSGFRVIDLGVDVPEQRVVEAVERHAAGIVALSVLLTPMVASVGEVVAALEQAGVRSRVKILIGGACTTAALAEQLRVDAMGRDPMEAVRLCDAFLSAQAAAGTGSASPRE